MRTDYRLDEGDHAGSRHYVDKTKLTEAYLVGTLVIALCGKVWVSCRDPTKFPLCPEQAPVRHGPEGRAREWAQRRGE